MMSAGRRAGGLLVVAAAVAAAGSLAFTCGPAAPMTETCELVPPTRGDAGEPLDGTVESLEIGHLDGDGRFAAFTDDEVALLQLGGQGSTMIVAHLRLRGSDVPACIAQRTVMEYVDGEVIASEIAPLPTDRGADGSWITTPMFLVYDREEGARVRLRAEVDGVSRSVEVWIGFQGIDAGVDARPPDAAAAVDATPDA